MGGPRASPSRARYAWCVVHWLHIGSGTSFSLLTSVIAREGAQNGGTGIARSSRREPTMNAAHDPDSVHGHEASPGPDGRVPSSTGRPSITIKNPGPEMYDPRAAEIDSPAEVMPGAQRHPHDFPVIDRDARDESEPSEP